MALKLQCLYKNFKPYLRSKNMIVNIQQKKLRKLKSLNKISFIDVNIEAILGRFDIRIDFFT